MNRRILILTTLVLALGFGSLGYAWYDALGTSGAQAAAERRGGSDAL